MATAMTTATHHEYMGADSELHGDTSFVVPGWAWDDVFGVVFVAGRREDGMLELKAGGGTKTRHRNAGHVRALTASDPLPPSDNTPAAAAVTPVRRQLAMRDPASVTTDDLASCGSSQETTLSQESLGSVDTPLLVTPLASPPIAQTPSTPIKAHSAYFADLLALSKGRRALRHTRCPKLYRWDYDVRGVGVCTFGGVDDGVV